MSLAGKHVLITGAARRVGRILAFSVARAGGKAIIHHAHSATDADNIRQEIISLGEQANILHANLLDSSMAQQLLGGGRHLEKSTRSCQKKSVKVSKPFS